MIKLLNKFGIRPNKFKYIYKELRNKQINILDIGCGNNSAFMTKIYFPECKYYGVDMVERYKNDKTQQNVMEEFYLLDLTEDSADIIENNKFDLINMSHVIEHLKNGDKVLAELIKKLKKGGYIYIEYPSINTISTPNMKNTLHFSDDETHFRLYDLKELGNILLSNDCKIIKGGLVKNKLKIIMFPIFYILVRYFGFSTNLIWDYYGFAEYIIGQKK